MRQPPSQRIRTIPPTGALYMSKHLDYPPFFQIITVLEECPSSIFLYVRLWKNKNVFQTFVKKKDVQERYSIDTEDFFQHLCCLQNAKVLFFEEAESYFLITLLFPDIIAEGKALC
jgi:hypothetical protein